MQCLLTLGFVEVCNHFGSCLNFLQLARLPPGFWTSQHTLCQQLCRTLKSPVHTCSVHVWSTGRNTCAIFCGCLSDYVQADCSFVYVQDAKDSEGNPIDAAFYKTFWGLQQAFQHPVETLHPDNWTKMVKDVKLVLAEFMKRPVAVSGRAPSAGTTRGLASWP